MKDELTFTAHDFNWTFNPPSKQRQSNHAIATTMAHVANKRIDEIKARILQQEKKIKQLEEELLNFKNKFGEL